MTSLQPSRNRVAFAAFNLESVSFLETEVTLDDFERVAVRGSRIVSDYRGSNTVAGGVIEALEQENIELIPLVHTLLGALGPASDEAVAFFCQEILDGLMPLRPSLDGVILFLHGACWAPGYADPERHIIEQVRRLLGPDVPIVVALDYHANIDTGTLEHADAAFAYRRSPHTDTAETGRRAAACIARIIRGEISPACAVVKPGVLIPSIFSATGLEPLAGIIRQAAALQEQKTRASTYCDITVLGGFSYADAHNTGMSVLCVLDGSRDQAEALAAQIGHLIREKREQLYQPLPVYSLDEAIARVKASPAEPAAGTGPLVLLEHADRMNDSTYALDALIRGGIRRVAVPFLLDRRAAAAALAAGVGATVRLALGGHSSDKAGPTLDVEAVVKWVGNKRYTVSGEYMRGTPVDLGLSALVDIDGISISIVSEFAFAVDDDPFRIFGLNLSDFDIVLLRSKTHFRAFYEPVARDILIVDTPDYGTADLLSLPYRHVDREALFPFNRLQI